MTTPTNHSNSEEVSQISPISQLTTGEENMHTCHNTITHFMQNCIYFAYIKINENMYIHVCMYMQMLTEQLHHNYELLYVT